MKIFSKAVVVLLAVLMLASVTGCSSKTTSTDSTAPNSSTTAPDTSKSTKYAKTEYNLVFIPKLVHPWYEDVKTGIDKACAELKQQGINVKYTWDAPADAVVTDQISKLESAASKNPDGISLAVID